jgi:hypothetical protein
MNAMHDYVLRMSKDELPPALAFWSLTLYDLKDGFFIPNDRKKYSVGVNAGFKLNGEGGIEIVVSAKKPESVPEENWLPINRKDIDINGMFRVYVPDSEKMKTWKTPQFEILPTVDADRPPHKGLFHDSDNQFRKAELVRKRCRRLSSGESPTDIESP